jgi:hypothetical protein
VGIFNGSIKMVRKNASSLVYDSAGSPDGGLNTIKYVRHSDS